MTAQVAAAPLQITSRRALRRKLVDRIATGALVVCLVLAVAPLALILGVVVQKGLASMTPAFLTQTSISLRDASGGWVHGLIGSLYMLALSSVIVLPLGIGAALYLVEFGNERLTGPIRFFTDVMTGVPSIGRSWASVRLPAV